jgi:cytochrome d ubiquinol oxidase subunit I
MWFMLISAAAAVLLWRGRLFQSRTVLRAVLWTIPLPLLACQLGWIAAEVGRQPWIVYGLMRRSDGFSTSLTPAQVVFSIIAFALIYLLLGTLYVYLLCKKVWHEADEPPADGRPPVSAAADRARLPALHPA